MGLERAPASTGKGSLAVSSPSAVTPSWRQEWTVLATVWCQAREHAPAPTEPTTAGPSQLASRERPQRPPPQQYEPRLASARAATAGGAAGRLLPARGAVWAVDASADTAGDDVSALCARAADAEESRHEERGALGVSTGHDKALPSAPAAGFSRGPPLPPRQNVMVLGGEVLNDDYWHFLVARRTTQGS
eukprot:scaffold2090_cov225-Prasinococcus_capsulatus_cf.AAC.39